MTNELIKHTGSSELEEAVRRLRAELSILILERDNLLLQECPQIETDYMLQIGGLEYQAYELEVAVARLKRWLELLQAAKNRGEKIEGAEVERILSQEFEEYNAKLRQQMADLNAALERQANTGELSPADTQELKTIYRQVVKLLHPDLHPEQTPEQQELFANAMRAYEAGDLLMMKSILDILGERAPSEMGFSVEEVLKAEQARLDEIIKEITEQIRHIKNSFPYNVRELLLDPKKIKARRVEIEQQIAELNGAAKVYKQRIAELKARSER